MPHLPSPSLPLPPGEEPPAAAPLPPVQFSPDVPAWHSHAASSVKLFLDFNGYQEESWGVYSNINILPYDSDGDYSSFNSSELANMEEIWRRVAEDYSPFDVDVTTEQSGSFTNGQGLRVAIGGDGAWTGGINGGLAYIGSFNDEIPNVVFVFPDNLGQGHPRLVAESISHEAGHGFGLEHQSLYDEEGTKTAEYNPGSGGRAPIMGDAYAASRSLWWIGPNSDSADEIQDDMAVLAGALGWRSDEAGGTPGTAALMDANGAFISTSGVITTTEDVDSWTFAADSGTVMINAQVRAEVANLDLKVQLLDALGNVIVPWQESVENFDVTFSVEVTAGYYTLAVASQGEYGDVGQYTVYGVIPPPPSSLPPPSNLFAAAPEPNQVDLSWNDPSDEETGYLIERSTDGMDWVGVIQLPSDSVAYTDMDVQAGQTYLYRVAAVRGSERSDYSLPASVVTPSSVFDGPNLLHAVEITSSHVHLAWNDRASDETGYVVERSSDGAWNIVAQLPANTTDYIDGAVQGGGLYIYRVAAVRDTELTPYSPLAFAALPVATPGAPTNLQVTGVTANRIDLAWNDNTGVETKYVVERTSDGSDWSVRATLPANTTTYSDTSLADATAYTYRVVAVNEAGNQQVASDYSNEVPAQTLAATPAPATNLLATPTAYHQIHVTWIDNADNETGYIVQRSSDGSTWTTIATLPANSTSHVDSGLNPSSAYLYRVQAVNAAADLVFSNLSLAQTPPVPPRGATGLRGITQRGKLLLAWVDNAVNETGYKVMRSVDGVNWAPLAITAANAKSIKVPRPPRNRTYYYYVVAVNQGGQSAPSGVLKVRFNTLRAISVAFNQVGPARRA